MITDIEKTIEYEDNNADRLLYMFRKLDEEVLPMYLKHKSDKNYPIDLDKVLLSFIKWNNYISIFNSNYYMLNNGKEVRQYSSEIISKCLYPIVDENSGHIEKKYYDKLHPLAERSYKRFLNNRF